MRKFINPLLVAFAVTTTAVISSSFTTVKVNPPVNSYSISLVSTNTVGTNQEWTWCVSNPTPGSGSNGTLQDISNWSMPLSASAEAALVSAQYSYDGITWYSSSTTVERNPSIRQCTTDDVLKFDVGTTGTAPTYYRVTLSQTFGVNPYATSWIKTGGGQQGCNMYFFAGLGSQQGG